MARHPKNKETKITKIEDEILKREKRKKLIKRIELHEKILGFFEENIGSMKETPNSMPPEMLTHMTEMLTCVKEGFESSPVPLLQEDREFRTRCLDLFKKQLDMLKDLKSNQEKK